MSLPTDYRDEEERRTYYVYYHYDDVSDEIVYVGHGYKSRAWIHSNGTSNRSPDHSDWMELQDQRGRLPCDYVEVYARGMTKSQACDLEQRFIRQFSPKFNKPQGISLLKMAPDDLITARALRQDGLSYSDIAKELNVSTMTVYRALTGRTKNIGEDYAG